MTQATLKLEPSSRKIREEKLRHSALVIVLLVYAIAWVVTRAHFMADTIVYGQAILLHHPGVGTSDYRLSTSNPFWDFGHLLWRPLGWLCFVGTRPITQVLAHQNSRAEVILTLLGINFLAALGCVVLFFLLARRLIGNDWPTLLATIGFFSADAFLNYAHSGSAYVTGLAFLVAGIYFSFAEPRSGPSMGVVLLPSFMFALAVLFWFPYLFVLPAAIAAPLLLRGYDRPRLLRAGKILATCAAIGLTVYALAVAAAGISDLKDLREWIVASGHGQIQPVGFRAAARLAFSLPRSFINMDYDGLWLKRYLLHDPYAPVTIAGLFRLSLWKPVLFYAAATVVGVELLRQKREWLLLLIAGAVLPICFFAVFIFEAGSIERYLPLYPFVFLAYGYVLAHPNTSRVSRIILFIALAATIAVNINAMREGTLQRRKAETETRIHDLVPLLKPNDTVMAVNEQDDLAEFRQNFPLDAINLERGWQSYDVLEINTARLATWREDFAARVLKGWQSGGVVWLPMRFFRDKPDPQWNWAEGDDTRVKWTDLPTFFSQFQIGPVVGGVDGFAPFLDTPANRAMLTPPKHGMPGASL
jgi:hypothetical protein